MKDMKDLMEARERMNLRRHLWFRCMDKAALALGTPKVGLYTKALWVLAEAYSVSCEEVRMLEQT
jgi:hypothetical protein